jgi:hypothetical protein
MQVKSKVLYRLTALLTTIHSGWSAFKHGVRFVKERLKEGSTYTFLGAAAAAAYPFKDSKFTYTIILIGGVIGAMIPNKKKHNETETVQSGDTPVG